MATPRSTLGRGKGSGELVIQEAEQLIAQGKTVADSYRMIEVSQPTYHRWQQQYGGM